LLLFEAYASARRVSRPRARLRERRVIVGVRSELALLLGGGAYPGVGLGRIGAGALYGTRDRRSPSRALHVSHSLDDCRGETIDFPPGVVVRLACSGELCVIIVS